METVHIDKLAIGLVAHRRRRYISMAGLLGLLAVVIGVACSIGTASIPFADVWKVLLSQIPFVNLDGGISGTVSTIVVDYRLPRILLAGLVGASLSTAGATYQGLFRNPLADPYLLGVAQGAGLGAVIGFMLPFSSTAVIGTIPLMALCGGSFVIVILYLLARVGKTLPMTTLILAGVAMGSFLFAITSFLLTQSGDKLHGILFWLMGSFTNSQWNEVYVLAPYLLVSIIPIYLYSRPLNLIQMDEDQAKQLGVNVEKVKIILLLTATLITAAAVSFAGCIGFVGIIIPHAVRLIWGPDYRFLLPLSTIVGAIFLILTDTLARTATGTAQEIPVGVITALIGAPFFLYLLRQKKRVFF
ncbi:MAG: iron chelate uptake ABC transporter family permease subunit [Dehalococcoidia bacterium]